MELEKTDDKNKNRYLDKNAIVEESETDTSSHELNSDSPDLKHPKFLKLREKKQTEFAEKSTADVSKYPTPRKVS